MCSNIFVYLPVRCGFFFSYRQLRYQSKPRIEKGLSLWILMNSDKDRSTEGMVNSMMTCGLDMKLGLLSHEAFAVGTSSLTFGQVVALAVV